MTTILSIDTDAYRLFDIPNETGTPERRLILAILERAILDYVGNDEREAEDALAWIFDELPGDGRLEFSFSWICDELDLDRERIRGKIRSMPKRGSCRIAPWYMDRATVENQKLAKAS